MDIKSEFFVRVFQNRWIGSAQSSWHGVHKLRGTFAPRCAIAARVVVEFEEMAEILSWHNHCDGAAVTPSRVQAPWPSGSTKQTIARNKMKLSKILTVASLAVVLALSADSLMAQENNNTERQGRRNREGGQGGQGNFDPAEFQQRMMERTKETLEITDDTEWKAVEPLVAKVMEARRETLGGLGRGFGRGGRGGGDNGGGGRAGFGTPSPEAEALQKAIDAKASNSEIKAALAKYEAARKAKQAALEKAQADLRKFLTPRQEALAAMNGLL